MKLLRGLIAIALVCGLSGVAKAVNFQMVVIDPDYTVHTITDDNFTFSFSPCAAPGQIPVGTPFVGCFTGQNETGEILTSLSMHLPLIGDFGVDCSPFGGQLDLFQSATCTKTDSGYLLDFTGGDIKIGEQFTIAEAGVDPGVFPQVTGVFDTPEPSSIWLLSTGVLTSGIFLADWRKRIVGELRS
jgi:hypothetical protein